MLACLLLALLSCAPAPVHSSSTGSTAANGAGPSLCFLIQLPPYDRPCDQVCAVEGARCPGPASSVDPAPSCSEPAAGSPFYMCRCCAGAPLKRRSLRRPGCSTLWPLPALAQVDGEQQRAGWRVRPTARRQATAERRIGTHSSSATARTQWQRGPYFFGSIFRHLRQQPCRDRADGLAEAPRFAQQHLFEFC